MSKVCYLILAHNDIANLKRLVDSINYQADFIIHIDKKSDILPFKKLFLGYENISFLDDKLRSKIYWGGFSIVQAEINLVNEALKRKKKYIKYVLLSGADYPIKPAQYIYDYLLKNEQIEFIRGINMDQHPQKYFFSKHIDVYQIHDYPFIRNTNSKFFYYLRASVNKLLRRIKLTNKVRCHAFDLYQGSQWWALSYECLVELMDIYDKDKDSFVNFRFGMFAPDEKFFHTLFFQSKYREKNIVGGEDTPMQLDNENDMTIQTANLANIHLLDTSMTKWFNEDDFEAISKSEKLFVRKVKTGYSDELLDLIDKKILKVG
ncbi:beta-1,6-N-acetylglucosaminyltransferase [Enterococcus sp. AZ072]|uniref:beta-1,6-N-acetylglucosaminyltransferase n=1 Tax=unclassified Enterococcus TaxID=2608891 RepID=UPI003D2A552E